MIESDRAAHRSDSGTLSPAVLPQPAPDDGLPLRFLLIRTKAGELPWLAQAMAHLMAPVQIVQVVGMANALWRLGQERFDSVLLDVDLNDRQVIRRCREQILDIAVVPVLDLADPPAAALEQAGGIRQAKGQDQRQEKRQKATGGAQPGRQTLRLPWQRRPKRQPEAPQPKVAALG
jgi:hypothetical protein